MYERILVAVDGSPHAKRAVEAAVELAQRYDTEVHLLHVIRDLSLPREILEMIASGEITESRREILEDSAEIILSRARETFEAAGLTRLHATYVMGDPAQQILAYAHQHAIGLIVIGHRGLGPHTGLLGGVARKLLNLTDISILVVA